MNDSVNLLWYSDLRREEALELHRKADQRAAAGKFEREAYYREKAQNAERVAAEYWERYEGALALEAERRPEWQKLLVEWEGHLDALAESLPVGHAAAVLALATSAEWDNRALYDLRLAGGIRKSWRLLPEPLRAALALVLAREALAS